MSKHDSYREERLHLSSPTEIHVNDRLQRNSDHIVSIELGEDTVIVSTRWGSVDLPQDQPVYVWRAVK